MTVYHPKMTAMSHSNVGDIWRTKRPTPMSHRYKQNGDKVDSLKKCQVEILSRSSEMNANVKPFHPRNKGLARSEGLWDMYCNNKPDLVIFDRQLGNGRSSWPDAGDKMLSEQIKNSNERALYVRTYEERDFWGYFLPNSVFTKKRKVSWGLSVPTDWKSPAYIHFPISSLDEIVSDKSSVETKIPATSCASSDKTDPTEFNSGTPTEISTSFQDGRSNRSHTVLSNNDKARFAGHMTYNMNNILFGTPSRSESRKRRQFPGVSRVAGDSCCFYRSNSSPVLTAL